MAYIYSRIFIAIIFECIKYNYAKSEIRSTKIGIIKNGMEGYKVLSKYANVKTVFIIMSIYAVLGRLYETYKVAVSDILLGLKPEGIIYFDYALAIGGLCVPLLVKSLVKHNQVIIFTISTMITAIGFTLFGYSHDFIFTFIILVILGVAQNVQGTFSITLIQNNIHPNYIGRVFAFYKILLTLFTILGLLLAAPLYNSIDIGGSFLSISVVLIILCVLHLRYWFNKKHNTTLSNTIE